MTTVFSFSRMRGSRPSSTHAVGTLVQLSTLMMWAARRSSMFSAALRAPSQMSYDGVSGLALPAPRPPSRSWTIHGPAGHIPPLRSSDFRLYSMM